MARYDIAMKNFPKVLEKQALAVKQTKEVRDSLPYTNTA